MTPLTSKLLPPPTDSLLAERFYEITNEEAALLHRLELKIERALYRAAVGLRELANCDSYDPTQHWIARVWGDEQKVKGALSEAKTALQELQTRRLYRSTHQCFSQYLSERFGWVKEEIYPEGADLSSQQYTLAQQG